MVGLCLGRWSWSFIERWVIGMVIEMAGVPSQHPH